MVARHKVDESKIFQGENYAFGFGKESKNLFVMPKEGNETVTVSLKLSEYDKEMLIFCLLGESNIPAESFLIKAMKNVVEKTGDYH